NLPAATPSFVIPPASTNARFFPRSAPRANLNSKRAGSPVVSAAASLPSPATKSRSSSSALGTAKPVPIFPMPLFASTAASPSAARSSSISRIGVGKRTAIPPTRLLTTRFFTSSSSKATAPFSPAQNRTGTCRRSASLRQEPGDLEAILFGVAGFLAAPDRAAYRDETRGYVRNLWDRWWPHRDAMQRVVLPANLWQLGGARPLNHPQRRLGALAILAKQWPGFIKALEKRDAKT